MKFIKIILFFSFTIIFISCNDNPVEPETAGDYFPLQNGNKWYYKSISPVNNHNKDYDLTYEVIGDTNISGTLFKIMEVTYYVFNAADFKDTIFCNTIENKLLWKTESGEGNLYNILYADFSAAEGDTFSLILYGDVNYLATVSERNSKIVKIQYLLVNGADGDFEVTFLKDVGIMEEYSIQWEMGNKLVKYELR